MLPVTYRVQSGILTLRSCFDPQTQSFVCIHDVAGSHSEQGAHYRLQVTGYTLTNMAAGDCCECRLSRNDLQGIDVVWCLQVIQLLLNIGHDILLEAWAAKQVKRHTCHQHVHCVLDCNSLRRCSFTLAKRPCSRVPRMNCMPCVVCACQYSRLARREVCLQWACLHRESWTTLMWQVQTQCDGNKPRKKRHRHKSKGQNDADVDRFRSSTNHTCRSLVNNISMWFNSIRLKLCSVWTMICLSTNQSRGRSAKQHQARRAALQRGSKR